MKLRRVKIKNFRCLVDVEIPIRDTTILVGENNSGKTAFLDALRIALRGLTGRGNPFSEYDYYMCKHGDSPETSDGIEIELWFCEDSSDEWPASLVQALNEIIQTDPTKDLDSIGIRVSSKYDSQQKSLVYKAEFLNIYGQPLSGRLSNPFIFLQRFSYYIRLFYLPSPRNPEDEFNPRSQFWGRIMRDLKVSDEKRASIMQRLKKINDDLLKEDPRLDQVVTKLDEVQKLMDTNASHTTSIKALPITPWDLMAKAELAIRPRGNKLEFPLSRQGQGTQSLAVLFLFQAFVEVLLKPTFEPETVALLAMEEPEAHLHPQATRSLAIHLNQITSQKIISSHSPYFIQEIPLENIRLFRRLGAAIKVFYVKSIFTAQLPSTPDLIQFCQQQSPKYEYSEHDTTLFLRGRMEEQEKRNLLMMYPNQNQNQDTIIELFMSSKVHLTDYEISDLETYAKRIRGEIFFARAWLLCEGQSEYLLLRFFAELRGTPLDQGGIALIDFMNNGSIDAFIKLAQTLGIPWFMTCDGDEAGNNYVRKAKELCRTEPEKQKLIRQLPQNKDFEEYLYDKGFDTEYLAILTEDVRQLAPLRQYWVLSEKSYENREKKSLVLRQNGDLEIEISAPNQNTVVDPKNWTHS
jgi:putative ATP-dependent endonuclease of OLD family